MKLEIEILQSKEEKALTFERWSNETLPRRRHPFESSFALRLLPRRRPPIILRRRRRRRRSHAPPMAWWLSASSRDGMTIPRSSSTVSSTPTSSPPEISASRSSSTMRRRGSGSSGGESATFTTTREGFCSFSSLPLAVPQFTRLRTLRLRDLIPPSRSTSSATSRECFSCSLYVTFFTILNALRFIMYTFRI